MRILHLVTNAELGGAQSVVAELAAWAVANGHEAAVASQEIGPMWGRLEPRVKRIRLPHMVKAISPINDVLAFREIKESIREYKPDIIHLHSSKAGVLGRLAAGSMKDRTVYTVHGFDTILRAHRSFLPLERALQGLCGAIVAVSEYDRGNLLASGIGHNLCVIRNGVRDWFGVSPGDEAAATAMRRAHDDGGAVLCIARLAAPKRFDIFCEVAERLPDTGFFWLGNDIEVDSSFLPRNVRLLGSLSDAGAYANLADLLVLFSDYEGLPISILEALSCGTPVVASRVGGIPEILDGECGETVPNDAALAREKVVKYLPGEMLKPPQKKDARAAARKRYLSLFSVETMTRSYLSLYKTLCAS